MADLEYKIDIETKQALNDLKKLVDQMKNVEKQTTANDSAFAKLSKGLGGLKTVLAGVVGAGGLGLLVKNSIDAADAIGKAASASSISTDRLQELRYAFGFAGIGAKELDGSLAAFNKRLGRFVAEGGGAAKNALTALGLAADITSGQLSGTEAVINEALERLALVEDEAARAGLAAGIFGDTLGPKLAAALSQGTGAIQELSEEAHRMNQVISEEGVRASESLNDQISKLSLAISGSFTKAVVEAAPEMDNLVKLITENQGTMQGLVDLTFKLAEGFVTAGGAVVGFAQDLGLIDRSIEQQISKIEEVLQGGWDQRLRFFGPEGLVEYYDDDELNAMLSELKAKLAKQQEDLASAAADAAEKARQKFNSGESADRRSKINFLPDAKAAEEEAKKLQKIAEDHAKAVAKAAEEKRKAEEEYNRELQQSVDMYTPVYNKLREIETVEKNIQALRKAGMLDAAQIREAERNLAQARADLNRQALEESREWSDGWNRAFEEYIDEATNAAKQAEDIFRTSTDAIKDAIVGAAKTGKFAWQDLANAILNKAIDQQAGILAGNLTGSLGSIFAGFFANGGTIPSGQVGVVGERGPELVQGPATVTPMSGGSTSNITYNINAVDAASFKQMIARDPAFIYAVTEEGRRNIPSY